MQDPMLSKPISLRTFRFTSFVITVVVMSTISVLGIKEHADAALIIGILGAIAAFAGTYVGFGTWHDRALRQRQMNQMPPAQGQQ